MWFYAKPRSWNILFFSEWCLWNLFTGSSTSKQILGLGTTTRAKLELFIQTLAKQKTFLNRFTICPPRFSFCHVACVCQIQWLEMNFTSKDYCKEHSLTLQLTVPVSREFLSLEFKPYLHCPDDDFINHLKLGSKRII